MPESPARRYHSPQRDDQANATRRSILESAERLFAAVGFAAVTMQKVASEAGVALATVYFYFPGKAALIAAMADAIAASPELSVEQVEGEADPSTQLAAGAAIIRTLNERAWLVADILRSAHGTDAALEQAWALWQQRHLHAMTRAAAALGNLGALRKGVTTEEAADILYALAGTDVYRSLVRERGWTPERYERWLFELASLELLGAPPGSGSPGD